MIVIVAAFVAWWVLVLILTEIVLLAQRISKHTDKVAAKKRAKVNPVSSQYNAQPAASGVCSYCRESLFGEERCEHCGAPSDT
jgi:hypothetical protein